MQLLNRLEILSKTRDRAMLDPKPHWNQREWQADSTAKTAWKMLIDKSFKIPYTNLKIKNFTQNKWQLRWNNTLHIKLQDYKSRNRRMEGRIQKIPQKRSSLVDVLDTQTPPTHIFSNKNNHHGVWNVTLHIQ